MVLSSQAKVRFQDCDPFAHLNNARYIDYFLNARADQVLEHYKIDIFGSNGISWVVVSNQIAYFKPAFLNEEILLESQIISYSEKSIKVEMRMYDVKKTHVKAFIWVDSVPISLQTKRFNPHPKDLMERFKETVLDLGGLSFDDRRSNLFKLNNSQ